MAESWTFDTVLNPSLSSRCYLTSRVTLSYLLCFQAYSRLIQSYLALLRHIKSPGIFRAYAASVILRHILNETLHTIFRHSLTCVCILTLIWVVHFEVGGGGVKFPRLSKTLYNYARNLKFGT